MEDLKYAFLIFELAICVALLIAYEVKKDGVKI